MAGLLESPLLDERQLAEKLGVSVSTVRSWRYQLKGPPVRKIVRAVRYSQAEVEQWIEDQTPPWWTN